MAPYAPIALSFIIIKIFFGPTASNHKHQQNHLREKSVTKTEAIIENSTQYQAQLKKLKHKKLQKQHSQQSNQQEENNGMLYLNNLDYDRLHTNLV
jgi:hypothetical protein